MEHKKAFKILAFIALFLLIIFSWVIIKDIQKKKIINTPVNTGLENPFGVNTQDSDLEGNGTDTKSGSGGNGGQSSNNSSSDSSGGVTIVEDNPKLRQLSSKSTAGFTFVSEEREIPPPEVSAPDAGIVEVFDFSGYKTIKFGDKADEIVAIKTVLNRQNPSPGLTIDNLYDTDMKNAVIDFQNKNGLSGDGVLAGKTYMKLNALQGITTYTATKKANKVEIVPMVRYVDTATGILYDKAMRKMEEEKAITTTPVPKVAEAFFDNTGNALVMRYLKEDVIQTYIARLTFPKIDPNLTKEEKDKIKKTAQVSGEFLPENIKTIAVSQDHKNLFYLSPVNGAQAGTTYNFATKAKKQIFRSVISEWVAGFTTDAKINMTTRASGEAIGYDYMLDAKTGSLSKVLGGEKGLVTLPSPDGKKLLFAEYKDGGIATSLFDMTKGTVTSISPSTSPDKCVFTKDSKKIYCAGPINAKSMLYPDDWYKGKVSFDDALWVVDVTDMTGNIIYDFVSKNNVHIDATNLLLNTSEDYLGFINKKDGSLWGFDLSR